MDTCRKPIFAAAFVCAIALPAAAQVEYRYSSPDDTARTAAPQVVQQQQAAPQQSAPAAQPACPECGTVESIRAIEQPGEGSAVGVIAGGILGGLLGNQVGQGRGNTAATIVGAAGGAYAGHQIEKNVKKGTRYDVNVRMSDGALRTFNYDVEPGFRSGDRIRVVDGKLVRN